MFHVIKNEQTPAVEDMNVEYVKMPEFQEYANAFLDFAMNHKDPTLAGLASNQVGDENGRLAHRFCAVKRDDLDWVIAVNPIITSRTGEVYIGREGCATWPGKTIVAPRYPSISVEYITLDGKVHKESVKDKFKASVWQHEINHLNGVKEEFLTDQIRREGEKVGRNDPCPCGSQKKYKKCCAAA